MKKIAVFGKPGSGKSTLSKHLALATDVPLYPLDNIAYEQDGTLVEQGVFNQMHEDILAQESWIIDGFGSVSSFNLRLDAADTLIYIDLPYWISYWLVTKRMLKGIFVAPEGWPDGSSIVKGTIQSYKTLKLCPKFWHGQFAEELENRYRDKSVYVIRSVSALNRFIQEQI